MARLVDFDWSLRLVLSSQHLSTMRKPILMVDLTLQYADGSTKTSCVELNQADLDKMLQGLAAADEVIDRIAKSWPSPLTLQKHHSGLHILVAIYQCSVLLSASLIASLGVKDAIWNIWDVQLSLQIFLSRQDECVQSNISARVSCCSMTLI